MAPTRTAYIRSMQTRKALDNPMNQALVNKAAPTPALATPYWNKIAAERNDIADAKMKRNRNITSFSDDEFKKNKVMNALQAKKANQ